ncbi:MAG TPA: alginate export family protein [Candidatus Margulisiibacteriota bacterium]|nr:alginate export family protein [Candidatus Margulisiibacteriota bacterium]
MHALRVPFAATLVVAVWLQSAAATDEFVLRDHLTLSASDRVRGEFVSWFDPAGPKSNNNYNFFANRLRVGTTLSFPSVEFVVEGQDTEMVNLPGADAINTGPGTKGLGTLGPGAIYYANTMTRDQGEVFLHLGYATVRDFGLPGVSARVGRFGYNNGLEKLAKDASLLWLQRWRISQRLIGNFDYTNVGRSFDGAQAIYDRGPFNLTLMASHPTAGGYNVNANHEISDIDLVSGTASLVEPEGLQPTLAQFFYMYYGDGRNLVPTDNRPLNPPPGQTCSSGNNSYLVRSCDHKDIEMSTFGADVVHLVDVGPGKLDLLGWIAGQFGDWQSLHHTGWAYDLEAGYQLPDVALKPWLRFVFARASGDKNAADHDHNTFFQMIPTARIYALFPYFNMMNNQDMFLQGIVRPLPGLSAAVTGHWLQVTQDTDLWYAGGGATSSTFFGYSGINPKGRLNLSYLTDFEITYAVNKHLTLYSYYGRAIGQGAVSANFAGNNADYGYLEATVSF